ncbi:MAG: hypothetical protein AAFV33_16155 [Chloroflexota bacterium]
MVNDGKTRYEFDKGWLALFNDLNIPSQVVLRHAQLPLDLFTRKSITITGDEYFRLWRGLAFATRDDPTLPLRMGQTPSTSTSVAAHCDSNDAPFSLVVLSAKQ